MSDIFAKICAVYPELTDPSFVAKLTSPTKYLDGVNSSIDSMRDVVQVGNRNNVYLFESTCRFSSKDTAAILAALMNLQRVVNNAKIVPCGPATRPLLTLVASI